VISGLSPDADCTRMNQIAYKHFLKPEWLRISAATQVSGFSRAVVVRHIKDGSLKSKIYQVPGNKKISRFVNYDSLMALMEGLPDGHE
jgi:hypothetical protein